MPPETTTVWPSGYTGRTPGTSIVNEPDVPYCTDTDPNARHFCMDGQGKINPGQHDKGAGYPNYTEGTNPETPNPDDYYCDPHYDATDYARDRADFAGLVYYMDRSSSTNNPAKQGNFIAIYSIFFDHAGKPTLDENILGIKFMRYLADVGDNGVVDNHLQRWYRDVRDGVIKKDQYGANLPWVAGGGQPWQNPPTGLDESAAAKVQTRPGGTASFPGSFGAGTQKAQPPNGRGQPVPPTYDGADPIWAAFGSSYTGQEDPCAAYDYSELHLLPVPGDSNSPFETAAKQSCGQFFYASKITEVNKAFVEIASRLFTRLSR
jgi:hypothetical protein